VQEIQQFGNDRDARKLEAPGEDREVGVEPLRRQQRAACRAADADRALAADSFRLRQLDEGAQVAAMLGVVGAAKKVERLFVERRSAAGTRQHLGDQAAARMADEVDARARGQRPDQRQRVGDRADAEGRMVERVDAVTIGGEQLADGRVVQRPELGEGADGVGKSAMDEHQQRSAIGGGGHRVELATAALERIERVGRESIDAGVDLSVELLGQCRRHQLCSGILGDARDDLEAAQDRLAHPAARAAARRFGLEPGPAELGRNGDLAWRGAARGRGRKAASRRRRALREHQVARVGRMKDERRSIGDAQDDDVFARPGRDAHRITAAALGADANRRLDAAARR
jgi:hypothetical protein